MKSSRTLSLAAMTFALAFGGCLAGQAQTPSPATGQPQVIQVEAKKYEFIPAEIHVKKGTRVQIVLHAEDRTHGFKLDLYPEGASQQGDPGLVFDQPQGNGKVKKGEQVTIEFTAVRAGTYDFRCAVFCGMGHKGMKGKLIVEE